MSETNHPPSDDSLKLAKQIDALSDEFEEVLVAGGRPKIEEFLLRFDAADKQQLLIELIEIEVHYRRQIGETITQAEYQCRFPGLATYLLDTTVHDSRQALNSSNRNNAPDDNIVVKYFGEYELLQVIARGGMGVVYRARQESLNRIVALKMIISGELASPEEIDRFYSEAQAAALLDHPGIVPIYEVGVHDGKHYFSMAFVEGTSLAAKLSDGPLDPKTAARTVCEVADAVHYAHEHGVIHRDLKPSNILLDSNGRLRVTDFGLAKRLTEPNSATVSGQVLGTPSYMPPEQASGRVSIIGPASDVYALGAVLYTLTTGRPPFQAATAIGTLRDVVEKEPVSPRLLKPSIPRDLETIILKCLEKSLPRRYASARELADELRRFSEGRPIVARPLGRIGKTLRWSRRNPVLATLTSIVAIMLLCTLLGVAWLTNKINHIRKQRVVVQAFQQMGGEFIFASDAPTEWLEDVFNEELFSVGVCLMFPPENEVTDAGLARLGELSQLETLSLEDTSVTDAGLVHLAPLIHLHQLSLAGTQITNDGLTHLASLTELDKLDLSGTKITGDGLKHLQGLVDLMELDVTNTSIKLADVVRLYGPRGPKFFIRF